MRKSAMSCFSMELSRELAGGRSRTAEREPESGSLLYFRQFG
jgi:hypothetical protein